MLGLFRLHAFKPRKLAEAVSVPGDFIAALAADGIKTSYDYINLCEVTATRDIAAKYGTDESLALRLFRLCDIMRLPGVKYVRADLYVDSGSSLSAFANAEAKALQTALARFIVENGIQKSVPLLKELSTQIAVAKVLPKTEPLI